MLTVEYQKMNLRVTQQSNKFSDIKKDMRGLLHVNSREGVASFVEETKGPGDIKNPIVWNGNHLTLRIDKEGKLRGTFRVTVPETYEALKELMDDLDYDFGSATYHIEELSSARQARKRHLMGGGDAA